MAHPCKRAFVVLNFDDKNDTNAIYSYNNTDDTLVLQNNPLTQENFTEKFTSDNTKAYKKSYTVDFQQAVLGQVYKLKFVGKEFNSNQGSPTIKQEIITKTATSNDQALLANQFVTAINSGRKQST